MRRLLSPLLLAGVVVLYGCTGSGTAHQLGATRSVSAGVAQGGAAAPPLTVEVTDTDTQGRVFADPDGRVLYRYDLDHPGTIACTGTCTVTRTPLLHSPQTGLRLPPGIAGVLGTVHRPDGGVQVTLDDAPLYTFTGDVQPGDTNGVGLRWHVILAKNLPPS